MKVELKVIEGKPLGATIPLKGPKFLIGRDVGCHLRPKHDSVGPRHCQIRLTPDSLSIEDLGSELGTLLNGRRLTPSRPVPARHGDRLQIGNLVFMVSVGDHAATLEDSGDHEPVSQAATVAGKIFQKLGPGDDLARRVGPHLHAQTVDGVPVVSIEMPHVDDQKALKTLRRELRELADQPGLSRIILSLSHVQTLCIDAADLINAFHLRLEERGVKLKLCEVLPAVQRSLEAEGVAAEVPMYLDCHDAIWSEW